MTTNWLPTHVIPLRWVDLTRRLTDDQQLSPAEREQFGQFCKLMAATFHYEYHAWLKELEDLYAPFDPDSSTVALQACTEEERDRLVPDLFDKFAALLERANYERLSQSEIEQAVGVASDWGIRLRVNFDVFERLEVYSRGYIVDRRMRRRWRGWRRGEEVEVPLHQRLVVMFRLREHRDSRGDMDAKSVYIKLFKNIPRQDIDMLLPATRFRLTLWDRGKIILPTVSGIAIVVYKIVQGALLVAVAGLYGALAVLGLVGGTVGYGVKSFLGYLRTKERYQLSLTRSLYYQNLDNNAGVFYRVLDEAEEQEGLEAILAYALLSRRAGSEGWSESRLDVEAETYLRELLLLAAEPKSTTAADGNAARSDRPPGSNGSRPSAKQASIPSAVDFEVSDALAKLDRLGCATKDAAGRWHAVPLGEALSRLDQTWDDYFRPPASPDAETG